MSILARVSTILQEPKTYLLFLRRSQIRGRGGQKLKHLKLLHSPFSAEQQLSSTNRDVNKRSPWQIDRYALWLAPRLGSARIELVGHFVLSNCLKHGEAAGEQGAEVDAYSYYDL
jgi:hypothetical protein